MTTREAVIVEARSWIGTPYVHMGRIKGAGADCATLVAEVYAAVGVVAAVDVGRYSQQWHLNRQGERYLEQVLRYAHEVEEPLGGDLALYKFGRAYAHGAIITEWPEVVHADIRLRRVVGALGNGGLLGSVPRRYFSVFS